LWPHKNSRFLMDSLITWCFFITPFEEML